jgi:hypothetical protein
MFNKLGGLDFEFETSSIPFNVLHVAEFLCQSEPGGCRRGCALVGSNPVNVAKLTLLCEAISRAARVKRENLR